MQENATKPCFVGTSICSQLVLVSKTGKQADIDRWA